MKKVFKYSLFLLLPGLLWTSCNKEQIERVPADEDGEYSVTYTIPMSEMAFAFVCAASATRIV